jgi:hypothetical protein
MKRWLAIFAALFAVAAIGQTGVQTVGEAAAQADAGWITLFDGKNLDNWKAIGDANWRLEDGAVVADKGKGFLVSKDAASSFAAPIRPT